VALQHKKGANLFENFPFVRPSCPPKRQLPTSPPLVKRDVVRARTCALPRLSKESLRLASRRLGVILIWFNASAAKIRSCWPDEDFRHYLSILPGVLSSRRGRVGERKPGFRTMFRLRRAVGILARTKAPGLSAHSGASAQIFECSRTAVSRCLKSNPKTVFGRARARNSDAFALNISLDRSGLRNIRRCRAHFDE
jgi:hypothetical protein